jgi:LacI family transcriptional regulator
MSPPDNALLNLPHSRALPPRSCLKRILFVTDFYVEEVLLGIVEFAREANWDLITNMRFNGCLPTEKHADGIIATATTARVRDWLAERIQVPIVRMLTSMTRLPYPGAEIDYHAAGRLGARHLLDLGHADYGFYWLNDVSDAAEIRRGFVEEIGPQNLHLLSIPDAFPGRNPSEVSREERMCWLTQRLKVLPRPIAIMGDDDRRASEILRACDKIGLRVPDDVAIIGCNHAMELDLARIPLSSVQVNFRAVGYTAAAMLSKVIAGECVASEAIKVPPHGVAARRSTATFVTKDRGITAAVLYLREHFHTPLRIEQLARIAGMSKRVFEDQFRRSVGCSAREEIQRARMACAARLLRETDLKLDAIAVESGFGSGKYLSEAFSKFYGLGPSAWRQQVSIDKSPCIA